MTLDPTSYLGIINADGSLTSDDRDYNSTPIANLSNMSNETSAFYLMSEEDDTDAANDIDAEIRMIHLQISNGKFPWRSAEMHQLRSR